VFDLATTKFSPELQREIAAFTIGMEAHTAPLVDDLIEAHVRELRGFPAAEDPGTATAYRDAVMVGVPHALAAIRVPGDLPSSLPSPSVRNARIAARHGTPLPVVLQVYRTANAVFQEHVLRHAERTGASNALVRTVTQNLFAYYDWAILEVGREYAQERRSAREGGHRAWHARVARVVGGRFEDDLGYGLARDHLGVVLDARCPGGVAAEVAEDLGVPVLTCVAPDGRTWAWLGVGEAEEPEALARLTALDVEGSIGVGDRQAGPHGFAATHRKADVALRLGLMRDVHLSRYADVALEALAFGGQEMAADFVRAELGQLAETTDRAESLRCTVRAYFAAGNAAAGAARELGVAERTVTYRLRRAEELIGRPLAGRRAELETALRLYDVVEAPEP
jgi:hypothetical protein